MDPIAPLAGFLQIVSLCADYHSAHKQRVGQADTDQLKDFLEWIATSGHQDLVARIQASHETTVSIKALLVENSTALMTQIQKLERLLMLYTGRQGALGALATSLSSSAGLADQQCDVLTQYLVRDATEALFHSWLDGAELVFLNATHQRGAFRASEPKFLVEDLDQLCSLRLLTKRFNSNGNPIYCLTRQGLALGRRLPQPDPLPPS